MKKFITLCCMITAVLSATSCDKPGNEYTGTNYIYLISETNSMYDTNDDAIDITVQLTTALKQDLTLTFAVTEDEDGIIILEGNPLTIAAGEKTGTITVKTKELTGLAKNFTITLNTGETKLPENVEWKEDFTFTVHTSAVPELTQEQTAIVEAYKAKTGIDLTQYLGLVEVNTVYTASNSESGVLNEPITITGKTTIVLSEQSTKDKPVLKMTVNPMGLTDELYKKIRSLTVENADWYDEYSLPCYQTLMNAINWTKNSVETFSVTLDGIALNEDKSIDFVKDLSYYDEEFEEEVTLFKVNFEYYFSAYEKEKAAIAAGDITPDEDWQYDSTANPDLFLNCEDISEDLYGDYEEDGIVNYIKPSAIISNDNMVFSFPIYNYNDYNYSKVVATYTPNK